MTAALAGIEPSDDESAYIAALAGAINSADRHVIEYVSPDGEVSERGTAALVEGRFPRGLLQPNGRAHGSVINGLGGGFAGPTQRGSHSVVTMRETAGVDRARISAHELLGHGVLFPAGATDLEHHRHAVRMENLVRRIMNLPSIDGSSHMSGETDFDPNILP